MQSEEGRLRRPNGLVLIELAMPCRWKCVPLQSMGCERDRHVLETSFWQARTQLLDVDGAVPSGHSLAETDRMPLEFTYLGEGSDLEPVRECALSRAGRVAARWTAIRRRGRHVSKTHAGFPSVSWDLLSNKAAARYRTAVASLVDLHLLAPKQDNPKLLG